MTCKASAQKPVSLQNAWWFAYHFEMAFLTQEIREEREISLKGACAVITLCSGISNFSSNVQNLAVKYKHEDV